MPFVFSDATTPSGNPYLRIETSGHVTLADGHAFAALIAPGAPHHRGLVLSQVAKGTEYSPDVRRYFPTLNEHFAALAVVVTSPIVRAAINLMLRFTRSGDAVLRMFTSEREALAWLESHGQARRSA
ncbi:STAS/SEC14 domain-containing protein [Enhygromyxa salina]|uniref:DUF7793 domain-containing protein n=1 Tax=Enhygromyxa salina TaxID=215803 RepID=A0A2S9XNK8_9BACT|nr:STAS/SEC14 domain-containing protein [Enhygromyxa salina]PRP94443.1 hypothetical protein ENSA7_77770 [Enhygromyxa salina]